MCVAIYKPENTLLSKRTLKKCFKANSDGAGYAYLDADKQAVIRKGFFTFNEFWKDYRDYADKEAIIHFRWATHGLENEENCHPFPIPDGALIHNGIISWCEPKPLDPRSDTRIFVEDLLTSFLADGLPIDAGFKASLETVIGGGNKIVMFHKGERVILNEQGGHWENGVWFSNLIWRYEGLYYTPSRTYIYDDGDEKAFIDYQKQRTTEICRRVDRDFKLRQRLIDNGSRAKDVDNVLGFDVSGRTAANDPIDAAYVRYLDKQGLWDEESDDEIAEDEERCDLCDKMIFPHETPITMNGQSMCRQCWLNYGDCAEWEKDLAKADSSDADYNDKLFAKYYRENY